MDEDIEHLILELKKSLSKKYGDNFKKFYLVNLKEEDWQVLITTKEDGLGSNYFKVVNDSVLDDSLLIK
jgi:hypothetical protein